MRLASWGLRVWVLKDAVKLTGTARLKVRKALSPKPLKVCLKVFPRLWDVGHQALRFSLRAWEPGAWLRVFGLEVGFRV